MNNKNSIVITLFVGLLIISFSPITSLGQIKITKEEDESYEKIGVYKNINKRDIVSFPEEMWLYKLRDQYLNEYSVNEFERYKIVFRNSEYKKIDDLQLIKIDNDQSFKDIISLVFNVFKQNPNSGTISSFELMDQKVNILFNKGGGLKLRSRLGLSVYRDGRLVGTTPYLSIEEWSDFFGVVVPKFE
jgi:hypothetical protein